MIRRVRPSRAEVPSRTARAPRRTRQISIVIPHNTAISINSWILQAATPIKSLDITIDNIRQSVEHLKHVAYYQHQLGSAQSTRFRAKRSRAEARPREAASIQTRRWIERREAKGRGTRYEEGRAKAGASKTNTRPRSNHRPRPRLRLTGNSRETRASRYEMSINPLKTSAYF